MTSTPPPFQRPTQSNTSGASARPVRGREDSHEIDIQEWLINLWSGRYIILVSLMVLLIIGAFTIWLTPPVYQAEALLQLEPPKTSGGAEATFTRMDSLFSAPSDVSTEIEIIGSNLLLGRTIESLNLDVVAQPVHFPLFGEAMARGKVNAPRVDVDAFQVPDYMRGLEFQITALGNGTFAWKTPQDPPTVGAKPDVAYPQGEVLATGRPGELLQGSYGGETLKLKLRQMVAKPGQRFRLVRRTLQGTITDMRTNLEAAGKGGDQTKPTDLLVLTFRGTNPAKVAEVLNEIMRQYISQNTERKREEITRMLDLHEHQLPEVHTRLEQAENRLNQFRARTGSVDIPREADLALSQGSNLASQISALKQKKQDLIRIYKEDSDMVKTVESQIAKLEGESAQVSQKVRSLPATQQELVRLSRDVQVSTELYTALLNNIQKLQLTGAGMGNARVIDYAMPGLKPIKPNKERLLAVFLMLGLFVGVGLVLLQRALLQGVEDHRVIESKLGIPVFVTVPHSKVQAEHYKALCESRQGSHLLALHDPEDLAIESLRSLRTMVNFSMSDSADHAIMITGPSPKVGKSFISSNFSVVLAQSGAQVLVVDGDMRRGNLHRYFGLPNRMGGLSDVLTGASSWQSLVHETETPGLHIVSSGRIPKNPAELLMAPAFGAFIEEASKHYDYVVIDAPPLLPVTDAAIIGARVGTVLLVTKFGQHPLEEIRTCQNRMESNGIPLKGCVFNDILPIGLGYYDQRYRYAYHYKYGQD